MVVERGPALTPLGRTTRVLLLVDMPASFVPPSPTGFPSRGRLREPG